MVFEGSSEPANDHDHSKLDKNRGSTVKLKRFEEVLVKGKSGKIIILLKREIHWTFYFN